MALAEASAVMLLTCERGSGAAWAPYAAQTRDARAGGARPHHGAALRRRRAAPRRGLAGARSARGAPSAVAVAGAPHRVREALRRLAPREAVAERARRVAEDRRARRARSGDRMGRWGVLPPMAAPRSWLQVQLGAGGVGHCGAQHCAQPPSSRGSLSLLCLVGWSVEPQCRQRRNLGEMGVASHRGGEGAGVCMRAGARSSGFSSPRLGKPHGPSWGPQTKDAAAIPPRAIRCAWRSYQREKASSETNAKGGQREGGGLGWAGLVDWVWWGGLFVVGWVGLSGLEVCS